MSFIHVIRTRTLALFLVACAVISLVPSRLVLADANQLVVTPSSLQTYVNSQLPTLNIKAYIDSSQSPQSAVGSITYPTNLLRVVGQPSTTGNGFGSPTINASAGTISFNASRNSSSTGFVQIFSVTFQAIGVGTAVVGFSGDSQVNGSTTAYKSSVISITNPNPTPTSSPAPAPSTTPKPSVKPTPIVTTTPTPTPTPSEDEVQSTPDPTGVITNVTIRPLYNSATVTWTVNAANAATTFSYGQKASTLDSQGAVKKNDDGTFSTTLTNLEPGNRYYFAITGSGANNANGTYSSTIVTSGYPVQLNVTENDISAKGAQIKIGSRTYTTASSGKVTIGLAAGSYNATIKTETASLTTTIVVAKKTVPNDGTAPETQSFSYKLSSSPLAQGPGSQTSIMAFVGALAIGTVILGFGFFGFIAYRRRKFESDTSGSSSTSAATVIIDDGYRWHQDTPQQPPQPTTPEPVAPAHTNSVYIDDEEPQDMFDKPATPNGGPRAS